MNKRITVEATLLAATWGAIFALPLVLIWAVSSGFFAQDAVVQRFPNVVRTDSLLGWQLGLAAGLGLLPASVGFWILWQLRGLFALYAQGKALTREAANRVRAIGLGLFGMNVLGIFANTAQTVVLSAGNPLGQRVLAIELGSEEIGLLLMGGLLFVIGRSMAEAVEAAEELRGFV
ncbi:MAG: DUF2975 domain-containing protein [Pseudomonadota bacterium]